MDLSNQQVMESNGWVFDVSDSMGEQYLEACGEATWYGWARAESVGSIEIVLEGHGMATLNFGNCFGKPGEVKVLLNDDLVGSANEDVKNHILEFPFSNGDKLKISEEHGIIKINSFEIKCSGKYYFII